MIKKLSSDHYDSVLAAVDDTPHSVIPLHFWKRGLANAYLMGAVTAIQGLVIQQHAYPNEPTAFGTDADAIWQILQTLSNWDCINLSIPVAHDLRGLMQSTYDTVRWYEDVYFLLADELVQPPRPDDIDVRLLSVDDLPLVERAPEDLQGAGFGTVERLLQEGIVAGGIVADGLIAIAHTSSFSPVYADVGVFTAEPYRQRGISASAAWLVMQEIIARGLQPCWSTGENNTASMRVAQKLGLHETERCVYLIPS